MTREEIKYHAYTELGFRPHEHKYVDALVVQIVDILGLPAARMANSRFSHTVFFSISLKS